MPPSVDQSLRKAKRYTKIGEPELAALQYKNVLQRFPQNQRAIAGLNALLQPKAIKSGSSAAAFQEPMHELMALYKQEQLQQVLVRGEALGKQFPKVAQIPNLMGVVNAGLGRHEQAVANFTIALQLKPDLGEALSNRGSCLFNLGKTEEAIASYRKALSIDPSHADANYNLGVALQALNKLDEAVASYRQAIASRPEYADAHYNLGHVLRALGKLQEATSSYRRAVTAKPDFVKAHTSLGNVLRASGKHHEAVASFHQALTIRPDFASAHHCLGVTLQQMGKVEEAASCYRKALVKNPEYAESYRHLAISKKFREYDDDIRAMEAAYVNPEVTDADKMHLAFGLGKSFEDLCQYEKAFDYYLTGNAIRRRTFQFSIEAVAKTTNGFKEFFTPKLFSRHDTTGSSDETAIFILGMPRSGTSLVEQILASHVNVYGAGELNYLNNIVTSRFTENGAVKLGKNLDQTNASVFALAGDKYIELLRQEANGEQFITDKMPLNFRLIGMIKLMLPNAKIIHCCRDPRDTCLSIFKTYFAASGNYYGYDLGELGHYHGLYRDLMAHWHKVLPDFIYDIQYEDLVADQEAQSKSLLAYCGLEWDTACLEFYKTERLVKTASFNQVRSPIYRNSVQSWKRYEKWLAPLLDVLPN